MPILFISAGCFVFSAVMEIFIHIPFEKSTDGKSVFQAVGSDLSDSFAFIKNEKPIFLSVLGILALFNLVLSAMIVVGLPVIVVQILGMSDTALGITQGAMGLGGLAGGIVAGAAAGKMRLKNGYVILLICSLAVSSCSQPVGQAIYGVLFDAFAEKPYFVMVGAAILSALISLYSKKVFAVLERESNAAVEN